MSKQFPDVSRSLLYDIVTDHLNCIKNWSRWVTKKLTDEHKTNCMSSALSFLTRYEQQGEILTNLLLGMKHRCAIVHMRPIARPWSGNIHDLHQGRASLSSLFSRKRLWPQCSATEKSVVGWFHPPRDDHQWRSILWNTSEAA